MRVKDKPGRLYAKRQIRWNDCHDICTADCNKQAEQWKTTIDLLCLNREEGHAGVGKIIRFICGKSIVVFHCSVCMLQDFCNLLYQASAKLTCQNNFEEKMVEPFCNLIRPWGLVVWFYTMTSMCKTTTPRSYTSYV